MGNFVGQGYSIFMQVLSLNSIGYSFCEMELELSYIQDDTVLNYSASSTLTCSSAFRIARVNSPVDAVPLRSRVKVLLL